jgi:hypothetical protein
MATLRAGISLRTSPQCGGLRVLSWFPLGAFSAPLKFAVMAFLSLSPRMAAPTLRIAPSPMWRHCSIGVFRPFSTEPKALS